MAPVYSCVWENELFRLVKKLLFNKTLTSAEYELLRRVLGEGRRLKYQDRPSVVDHKKVLGPKALDEQGKFLLFDALKCYLIILFILLRLEEW